MSGASALTLIREAFHSDSELLETFLRDMARALGFAGHPDIERVVVIRNPYSDVYRISLRNGQSTKVVYIKQRRFTPKSRKRVCERVEAEYHVISDLSRDPICGYGVITPLALYPSVAALVTLGVDGPCLSGHIRQGLGYLGRASRNHIDELVAACGNWLHDFHRSTSLGYKEFDVQDLLDYTDIRIDLLRRNDSAGLPTVFFDRFRRGVQERAAQVASGENLVAGRHNDFGSHNIICDGRMVRVLDFGMFDYGAAAYDACKFWLELELLKQDPMLSTRALREAQEIFIRSYGLIRPADPVFNLVQTRYMLNILLNALDKVGGRWWPSLYRKRQARACRAWLLAFSGLDGRG